MKFKIGNRIYNLGFLLGMNDDEWQVRWTETEGLVLSTLEEVEVIGAYGAPTGSKTVVWSDAFTVATGPDAKAIWEAMGRVLEAEKLCLDVDEFMGHVEEHDGRVKAARELLREEQRIRRLVAEEQLAETAGLSLHAIRARQGQQVLSQGAPVVDISMPPFGGKRGLN